MKALNKLVVLSVMLLISGCAGLSNRVPFTEEGNFSEEAIRRGVVATREQCSKLRNAVWADAGESGAECLKFWAAGFDSFSTKRALIFFHGDVRSGAGNTPKRYLESSNEKLQAMADATAKAQRVPYIYFARPGTYGSSGDHMQRRRLAESMLVSAAMDELRQRYGISEWVVAGQSGGGHVTAALLTERSDIVCAVPTSAPASPAIRYRKMGRSTDTTGFRDSYEPTDNLVKTLMHPGLRVFVLGNPQDKNVSWESQIVLADRLKAIGVPVELLRAKGVGPDGHILNNSAHVIAGRCARGESTQVILERADRGLIGILEEHVPRYGRETAQWVMEEELKHYTHIALIDTGVEEEMAPLRERAMENAAVMKKQYEEIPGSLEYFRELVRGPYTEEKFLRLRLGEKFTQEMFF